MDLTKKLLLHFSVFVYSPLKDNDSLPGTFVAEYSEIILYSKPYDNSQCQIALKKQLQTGKKTSSFTYTATVYISVSQRQGRFWLTFFLFTTVVTKWTLRDNSYNQMGNEESINTR